MKPRTLPKGRKCTKNLEGEASSTPSALTHPGAEMRNHLATLSPNSSPICDCKCPTRRVCSLRGYLQNLALEAKDIYTILVKSIFAMILLHAKLVLLEIPTRVLISKVEVAFLLNASPSLRPVTGGSSFPSAVSEAGLGGRPGTQHSGNSSTLAALSPCSLPNFPVRALSLSHVCF